MKDDEKKMTKGRIVLDFSVFCGCGYWDHLNIATKSQAKNATKRIGWKYTQADGYVCPRCQKKGPGK